MDLPTIKDSTHTTNRSEHAINKAKKLRIMHISDNTLPTLGGLERAVDAISSSWADDGHEVFVVSSEKAGLPKIEKIRENLTIFRLPLLTSKLPNAYQDSTRVFFPPVKDPLFAREFRKVLKETKPDVAHVHGWVLYSVIRELNRRNVPVISSAHDFGQVCAKKILVDQKGDVCDGPALRKCVTCSLDNYGAKGLPIALALRYNGRKNKKVSKELAISSAVAKAKSAVLEKNQRAMTIIPTFISDSLLTKAATAKRPQWLPQSPYILYVGVVHQSKGVETLIKAYSEISDQVIGDTKLVIIGEPNAQSRITAAPGVLFLGKKDHNDVLGAWRHATIGVVPSITPEGLSQTAIEALAASTPLIVSNHGGLLDVVEDGRYALTFQPGNHHDLKEKLLTLLGDPIKREHLKKAGPTRAANFTLSEVKPKLLDIYYAAIAENKSENEEINKMILLSSS